MPSPSKLANSRRAPFFVLEGVDGSGKSTQAHLLAEWYRAAGQPVLLTREPGGTALAERLRGLILDPAIACASRAELMMILAARAQHVAEVIAPAVQGGVTVISDRFSLSTLAYQGYGRGLPLDELRYADAVATGGCCPTLTVVLDIPLDTAFARIGERQDRFEGEGRAFLQRVVEGYRTLGAQEPHVRIIDGAGPVDAVQQAIRNVLGEYALAADQA
jgi:dTMP kinase